MWHAIVNSPGILRGIPGRHPILPGEVTRRFLCARIHPHLNSGLQKSNELRSNLIFPKFRIFQNPTLETSGSRERSERGAPGQVG